MNTEILIFSGFNMRAVLAFTRTLNENKIKFSIIASSEEDEIFKTSYYKNVLATRKYKHIVLDDILNCIREIKVNSKANTFLIAPSTEALNRFLLIHRASLDDLNCIVPLVERTLYEQISDKYSFGRICSNYKITIPKEYPQLVESQLPLVAKPKKYYSDKGETFAPQILRSAQDLKEFKSVYKQEDFYFQEYVNGRSIYLLYYFDKKQNVYKMSQENLIQQEGGKSMLLAKTSLFHRDEISSKFEDLFIDMGFRGLVMIELKLMDNRYYMIEANPRFWGPSQLFVDAGTNFFNYLLQDYGLMQKKSYKDELFKEVFYFWDDGISKNINDRKDLAFYNFTKEDFHNILCTLKEIEIYSKNDVTI